MYRVYVNGLLNVLFNHCYAIFINGLRIPSPRRDLFTYIAPVFLKTFMNICNRYCIKWRYDLNHSKSGIVKFREAEPQHFESLKNREWSLGDTKVEISLQIQETRCPQELRRLFSSNIDDDIDKTSQKELV